MESACPIGGAINKGFTLACMPFEMSINLDLPATMVGTSSLKKCILYIYIYIYYVPTKWRFGTAENTQKPLTIANPSQLVTTNFPCLGFQDGTHRRRHVFLLELSQLAKG